MGSKYFGANNGFSILTFLSKFLLLIENNAGNPIVLFNQLLFCGFIIICLRFFVHCSLTKPSLVDIICRKSFIDFFNRLHRHLIVADSVDRSVRASTFCSAFNRQLLSNTLSAVRQSFDFDANASIIVSSTSGRFLII